MRVFRLLACVLSCAACTCGGVPEPASCQGGPHVGPTVLHRLSQDQLARAFSPIFEGVPGPFAHPPLEPRSDGWDNDANVLVASDAWVEELQRELEPSLAAVAAHVSQGCGGKPEDCDRDALRRDLALAFRRPATDAEFGRFQAIYDDLRATDDHEVAFAGALEAALLSPQTLYRLEPDPAAGPAIAQRLSLFLWGGAPDDALLAAAADGTLLTPEGLETQVRRMIASPRFAYALGDFHRQWLGVKTRFPPERSPDQFPEFTRDTWGDEMQELDRFLAHVVAAGGRFETLLTGTQDDVNPAIARIYGLSAPGDWSTVTLPAAQRGGVLTLASVLTNGAHAQNPSPVLRGKLVRERIFCLPVGGSPAAATLPEFLPPGKTNRARYAAQTEQGSCASCHTPLNAPGYAFEAYDAIGRFRTTDGGEAVDDSWTLPDTDVPGSGRGAISLGQAIAKSPMARRCYVKQWVRYALGRAETDADACTVDRAAAHFEASDGDLRELVFGIATSDAFALGRAP